MKRVKKLPLFIAASILLSLFSGCDRNKDPKDSALSENIPFRILVDGKNGVSVDYNSTAGLLSQVGKAVAVFSLQHPELNIQIEYIPTDPAERTVFEENTKNELMSGNGPDVMILQNSFSSKERAEYDMRPFFDDVNLAMKNGLFYDLSKFYDSDEEISKGLNSVVMDAGVVGGARYVLPLRYDVPVVYVDKNGSTAMGLDKSIFDGTIIDFLNSTPETIYGEDVHDTHNFRLYGLETYLFDLLPNSIDYKTGKLNIKKEDVTEFLSAYETYMLRASCGPDITYAAQYRGPEFVNKITDFELGKNIYRFWSELDLVMCAGRLSNLMENLCGAKNNDIELEMYPLRSTEGEVAANITLFAAVSSGSKSPYAGYQFIREFLTEEYQWDLAITSNKNMPWSLSAPGWPVRSEGAVEAIAETMTKWKSMSAFPSAEKPMKIDGIAESDAPIIAVKIDSARFSIPNIEYDFYKSLNMTAFVTPDGHSKNADLDEMADDLLKKFQTHIDEG